MSETPRQKGRPKDPLKTQAILQAARKLFLEQGLGGDNGRNRPRSRGGESHPVCQFQR